MPHARWHCYAPIDQTNIHRGTKIAFGTALEPVYDFSQAEIIVSLQADFLLNRRERCVMRGSSPERNSSILPKETMNRLYVFEPTPSLTGSNADHHFPVRAAQIPFILCSRQTVGITSRTPHRRAGTERIPAPCARNPDAGSPAAPWKIAPPRRTRSGSLGSRSHVLDQ